MSSAGGGSEIRSYHGQPVLKEPVWGWEIPVYFYTGGVAGASAVLAYLADLRGNEVLGRRAWTVGLLADTLSPVLLTTDLGRPARFLNMLRMFKVTSPMSIGSWVLTGNGINSAAAALNAWTGLFPRATKLARPAAALFGLPLSTYTAALIANTAVPVWHEARRELPFVFAAGAALSAGAATVIATPTAHACAARRVAIGGAVLELAFMESMQKRLGEHAAPYKQGSCARFAHISRGSIAAGAALLAARGGGSRRAAIVSGVLLSAGALATRWAVFRAGFASAADPKYVIGPQREAIEQGRRRGAARRRSKVAAGEPSKGSPATTV
jgi:hypothetical protein